MRIEWFSGENRQVQRTPRGDQMGQTSPSRVTPRLLGIVSATGGPQVLEVILGGLPPGFAVPILLLPSVGDHFLKSFVAWLAGRSQLPVTPAEDRQVPEPGRVYVAGMDRDLIIERGHLRLVEREPQVYRPKDTLFRSMASELGPGAVAVILTGMGSDGARGMKAVRDAGGHTIAQDRATSLVYSTPRFAVEMEAARETLPLPEIGPRLLLLVEPPDA
jgi:two-component system, chemotaxis family, protein-glutamate methylesterase/glutaminase